jgi:hypothetical protein
VNKTEDAVADNLANGTSSNSFNAAGRKKVVKLNKDLSLKITEINM